MEGLYISSLRVWGCLLLKCTTFEVDLRHKRSRCGCTAKATELLLLELESFELDSS